MSDDDFEAQMSKVEMLTMDFDGETYVRLQDVVVWFLDGADAVQPQTRCDMKPLFEIIAEHFSTLTGDGA